MAERKARIQHSESETAAEITPVVPAEDLAEQSRHQDDALAGRVTVAPSPAREPGQGGVQAPSVWLPEPDPRMIPHTIECRLLHPRSVAPRRASLGATGYDLTACIDDPDGMTIEGGRGVVWIPTGVAIAVPSGMDAQVRGRSSLTKAGVWTYLGTIDPDYRGEILVGMAMLAPTGRYTVRHGDRIAQVVFGLAFYPQLHLTDALPTSDRGEGGFGSTGR